MMSPPAICSNVTVNGPAPRASIPSVSIGPWIETDFDPADRRDHLPCQRRDAPDVLHPRHGIQHPPADRFRLLDHDPGSRRHLDDGHALWRGSLRAGDNVEVSIEGLGILSNPVVAEPNR